MTFRQVQRWYLRFNLSYRDVEELPVECGVEVAAGFIVACGSAPADKARGCPAARCHLGH
jgi:transposase-like protein